VAPPIQPQSSHLATASRNRLLGDCSEAQDAHEDPPVAALIAFPLDVAVAQPSLLRDELVLAV
jgi:hypothetical protein